MELTPDQLHVFKTSTRWSDFRLHFLSRAAALQAYSVAAQSYDRPATATHQLEWRLIYYDRESGFLLFLALLSTPLGIHYSRHNEYRFITAHALSREQAQQLFWGRTLGSLCYYACFILILLCGTGLMIGVISQLYGGYNLGMTLLSCGSVLAFGLLFVAAGKSRSLGLPDNLKTIAKDTFDLLSVRKIKTK